MPLNLFYTMVQKSQKWPKTQIKGGPALIFLFTSRFRHPIYWLSSTSPSPQHCGCPLEPLPYLPAQRKKNASFFQAFLTVSFSHSCTAKLQILKKVFVKTVFCNFAPLTEIGYKRKSWSFTIQFATVHDRIYNTIERVKDEDKQEKAAHVKKGTEEWKLAWEKGISAQSTSKRRRQSPQESRNIAHDRKSKIVRPFLGILAALCS